MPVHGGGTRRWSAVTVELWLPCVVATDALLQTQATAKTYIGSGTRWLL